MVSTADPGVSFQSASAHEILSTTGVVSLCRYIAGRNNISGAKYCNSTVVGSQPLYDCTFRDDLCWSLGCDGQYCLSCPFSTCKQKDK